MIWLITNSRQKKGQGPKTTISRSELEEFFKSLDKPTLEAITEHLFQSEEAKRREVIHRVCAFMMLIVYCLLFIVYCLCLFVINY